MSIIRILTGLILLLVGRKLYWLFIAVLGFIAGFILAEALLPEISTWILILISLIIGSLCALLAVFVNQLAVALAGFLGGGMLAVQLIDLFDLSSGGYWILFLIGGIIGVILAALLFDWVLIVLSSLAGAILIGSVWQDPSPWVNILILILFLVGLLIQASLLRRERKLTT